MAIPKNTTSHQFSLFEQQKIFRPSCRPQCVWIIYLPTICVDAFLSGVIMSEINPCMTCGACCAYFRVSFYWAEADDAGGIVPTQLTEPLTPFLRCMSGTNQRQIRCAALTGEIGESVHCAIYQHRPSPCREFASPAKAARLNDACNRARARYGLPPLIPLYKDILSLTTAEAATQEGFAVQSPAS
jgi:Fe-S-cluster containining protein